MLKLASFANKTAPHKTKILGVDHVINGIYISGAQAVSMARHLRHAGIKHILKLYAGDPFMPRGFTVYENPISDGLFVPKAALSRGVDFIMRQVHASTPVLVMCRAGISRSSTFVLSYLIESGYDAIDAYKLLFEKHPDAEPHRYLWESLIVHHDLPYSVDDLKNML
jgi:protein-tyrosine phosphatase